MEWILTYLVLGAVLVAILGSSSSTTIRSTGVWIGGLAVVALTLPSLHSSHALGWAHSDISIDGDEMTVTIRDRSAGVFLHMEADGEVRFNDSEDDIAYLEPRSRLEIDQDLDGVEHELVVTSDRNGNLSYDYQRDDADAPFDAQAREWLSVAIPYIYRASGLQAEERVARIHASGGSDAVLAEIELIRSDYSQRIYYSELVVIVGADDALADVYRHAGNEIGSDFELRQLLSALPTRSDLSREQSFAILEAATAIDSDFELSTLLVRIADQLDPNRAVAMAYLDTARGIDSDFEMNKALDALAEVSWIDRVPAGAMFDASREISSDFELATFLMDSVQISDRNDEVFAAYLRAAETVGSDFELSRVLQRLVQRRDLRDTQLLSVIETAYANVGSDFEHSQVLVAIAPQIGDNPELVRAYERAAERLGQHQYGLAMRALVSAR